MATSVIPPVLAGPSPADSPTVPASPESSTNPVVPVLTSMASRFDDKGRSVPVLHQHMERQPDSDTLPLVISTFKNEQDNVPYQRDLTWAQLPDKFFKAHTTRKDKKGGLTMSPVSYKPGAKRGNQGVDLIYCAVFDVEHHGPFEALREKLHGYAYLAHSSYSHTLEDPRFRIILPLASPVPADQWPHFWAKLNQWLGGINDPLTKDAARIYYLPSHAPDATGHFIESGEGQPVNVADLPELPPEQLAKVSTQATRNYLKVKIDGIEDFPPDPLNPVEGLERVVAHCKFMAEVSLPEEQKTASRATWRAMMLPPTEN